MSLVEKRLAILERQNSDQRALIARLENELAGLRAFKHAVRRNRLAVNTASYVSPDCEVTTEFLQLIRKSAAENIANYLIENGLVDIEEPDLRGVFQYRFFFVPGWVIKAVQL